MRPIPDRMRAEMQADPFYQRCCLTGKQAGVARIEWHHNLIFAGRQVNEKFCILPLCKTMHSKANNVQVRELLDWVMVNRATDEELQRFSKVINWVQRKKYLNGKYTTWTPDWYDTIGESDSDGDM